MTTDTETEEATHTRNPTLPETAATTTTQKKTTTTENRVEHAHHNPSTASVTEKNHTTCTETTETLTDTTEIGIETCSRAGGVVETGTTFMMIWMSLSLDSTMLPILSSGGERTRHSVDQNVHFELSRDRVTTGVDLGLREETRTR